MSLDRWLFLQTINTWELNFFWWWTCLTKVKCETIMFNFHYFISANKCNYLKHKENNIAYRWRRCFKLRLMSLPLGGDRNVYICRSTSCSYCFPSLMVCRPGESAACMFESYKPVPWGASHKKKKKGLLHTVCCSINDLYLFSAKKTLSQYL